MCRMCGCKVAPWEIGFLSFVMFNDSMNMNVRHQTMRPRPAKLLTQITSLHRQGCGCASIVYKVLVTHMRSHVKAIRPPVCRGEETGRVFHLWATATEAGVMLWPWWAERKAPFHTIQLTIEVGRNRTETQRPLRTDYMVMNLLRLWMLKYFQESNQFFFPKQDYLPVGKFKFWNLFW